jgi:threonine dehydrogenase-like Zn-dependent dehydrogenase
LGICGTDREILASQEPWVPEGEPFLILGHECLAVVEEAGSQAGGFKPGDFVVPVVRRAHRPSSVRVDMLSFGQFSERGIVQEHGFSSPWWLDRPQFLFPVEPTLARWAVFAEPLAVAEKAINESLAVQRGRLGESAWADVPPRVLITGLGPIAFAGVLAARARGWATTVWGRDACGTFRASLAQALGAEYRPASHEVLPADIDQDGFDLMLECTGSDEVMLEAARFAAPRGVIAWLGSSRTPEPALHNVARLMRDGLLRNQVHLGCVNAAPRDFEHALEHLRWWRDRDPASLASIITCRIGPAEALWHYEHREPQGIKVVVEFE